MTPRPPNLARLDDHDHRDGHGARGDVSDVAGRARELAGRVLPRVKTQDPPTPADVAAALAELRQLAPVDAHDEAALHEVGEILLRLRDAAEETRQPF